MQSSSFFWFIPACIGLLIAIAAPSASHGQLPADSISLDSLDLTGISQDWGKPHAARSVDNNPLRIGGREFSRGVGTHANSEWVIDLKGSAITFSAMVGVDSEVGARGSVVFVVTVDGREVVRTDVMRGGQEAKAVSADLKGAKELVLSVEDAGDDINYDHADWADAVITLAPGVGGGARPASAAAPPAEEPLIAPVDRKTTAINPPRVTGASPGHEFLFRIPVSGAAPITVGAKGLPEGLSLDGATGIIRGVMAGRGRWTVTLWAEGPGGRAESSLTIVCEPGAVALTPPMGWNSWNVWGTSVDDAKVRAAADAIERLGLAAHGYQYVNIDDAWEGSRDEQGRIRTNEKFPDMKALADYVHSKGLKLGIYSSPGPKTCAGYEGSYQHEESDARTYSAWGVDYLKYDWCSYGNIAPNPTAEQLRHPYEVMRDALRASGRDILFSLCQYGMGDVWTWGAQVGGNAWRTTGDITDTWSSMAGIGFGQAELHSFAGPGHWNDPDMLVVGQLGWGPSVRPTHLTRAEQVTHITLWSMLASPLLMGCDLTKVDDFTLALLTNPEVLSVSQDPLGRQAHRLKVAGKIEVWVRDLSDGTKAVAMFNRSRRPETVTVTMAELGLEGRQPVRELWQRKWVSESGDDKVSARVIVHGAAMFKVGRAAGEKH